MIINNLSQWAGNLVVQRADQSQVLEEKFEGLFPTWPTMLATILSLLIIMFVLGPLVYKAVQKMVVKRRKYIQDNIDQAERLNNEALLERDKANKEIMNARSVAAGIISTAKLEAEEIKINSIKMANNEANKIVALAKNDMRREKEIFEIESKKQIIEVAMAATKHVITKEVDKDVSQKMISDFIEQK